MAFPIFFGSSDPRVVYDDVRKAEAPRASTKRMRQAKTINAIPGGADSIRLRKRKCIQFIIRTVINSPKMNIEITNSYKFLSLIWNFSPYEKS